MRINNTGRSLSSGRVIFRPTSYESVACLLLLLERLLLYGRSRRFRFALSNWPDVDLLHLLLDEIARGSRVERWRRLDAVVCRGRPQVDCWRARRLLLMMMIIQLLLVALGPIWLPVVGRADQRQRMDWAATGRIAHRVTTVISASTKHRWLHEEWKLHE